MSSLSPVSSSLHYTLDLVVASIILINRMHIFLLIRIIWPKIHALQFHSVSGIFSVSSFFLPGLYSTSPFLKVSHQIYRKIFVPPSLCHLFLLRTHDLNDLTNHVKHTEPPDNYFHDCAKITIMIIKSQLCALSQYFLNIHVKKRTKPNQNRLIS